MTRFRRLRLILCVAPLFLLANLYGQNCSTTSGVTTCSTTTGATASSNGAISKANNYPVSIVVSGASGSVSKLTLTVNGLSAGTDDNIMLLLVSPSSTVMTLVDGYGLGSAQAAANVTFSDTGTALCDTVNNFPCSPSQFSNGSFQPVGLKSFDPQRTSFPFPSFTGFSGTPALNQFPGYAGTGSNEGSGTLANVFNGGVANGTWSLYLANGGFNAGTVAFTSWSISITTTSAPSTSTALTSADTTDTSLASNTSFVGDSVKFTASVTSTSTVNSGTVTFSIDGTSETPAVTVNSSGIATYTTAALTEGSHSIIATYNGDSSFAQSTSSTLTQTVNNHTTVSHLTQTSGTFCNTGSMTIPAQNSGSVASAPYPSHIYVGTAADPNSSNLSGTLTSTSIDLKTLSMSGYVLGLEMLLVSPSGQAYEFLSNAGPDSSTDSPSGVNITFADSASGYISNSSNPNLSNGTSYKPTVYGNTSNNDTPDVFISPAPQTGLSYAGPATLTGVTTGNTTLGEAFNGGNATGTWTLYVNNAYPGSGSVSGGWCIDLTVLSNANATTTTLTSSASGNDQFTDQSAMFTATVTSSGTAVTAGTVTFTDTVYNTATSQNTTTTLQANVPVNSSGQATYTAPSGTFTVQGIHTITATYNGFSGTTSYGTSFKTLSEQVDSHTVVSGNKYCNPGTLTIQGLVTTPYPMHVFVGGLDANSTPLAGTVKTVSVSLNGLTTATVGTVPDLKSLLTGPSESCCSGPGSTVFDGLDFFSHTSTSTTVSGVNLTFADGSGQVGASGALSSGTYAPSSYSHTNTYSSPAPSGPYQYAATEGASTSAGNQTFTTALTGNSQMPNGTWSFYFGASVPADAATISGGSSNNSVCVTVTTNPPAWGITSSHSGTFTQGGTATYTITVSNPSGPGSTAGTVTVTEIPPTGMTLTSMSGTGWTCTTLPTCTRSDPLGSGSSYAAIIATLSVSPTAATGTLTNEANVSGGGASNSPTAMDPTTILAAASLSVTKTHTGTLTQGSAGQYVVTVHNAAGAGTTSGTTSMSDSLPTGYTISSFSSGTWSCSGTGTQAALCTSTAAIAAGSSFPVIDINVSVPANSALTVTNTASVYGGGDPVHTSLGTAATGSDSNASVIQVASSIAATAGASQSAKISTQFTTQLQATVKDAGSNPVPNVTVTFTAPVGNASGTFAGTGTNTTTAVTNSSGIATAAAFTANSTAGAYPVTASAPGVLPGATFSLSNTMGSAASIAATAGASQSAAISTQFTTLLQATVKDSGSNPVQGVTVTFTAPASNASGTFADTHTATTTALTNSSGMATATAFTANNIAGAYSVTASTSGVTPNASFSLTNNAGSATSIAATAGASQSATISTAFATQLQATVKDSGSNLVQGVTVTFTAPPSNASGTFADTHTATTTAVANSSGIATAAAFTANGIAGAYSVTASASGVTPNATFSLTNNAGSAASIAATAGASQSATILTPFGTLLQATVKDAGSNLLQGVTVTFSAPGNGASGTFAGTGNNITTAVTNASGIATAAVFTANGTAGAYSVTASVSGVSPSASFSLTNNAGNAASVAATAGTPQSATISTAFATQLQATVKDSGSNLLQGVTVTFTAPVSGASGTFAGTGNNITTAITNASGIATAAAFTANGLAGSYNVAASVSGVGSSAAFSLTNIGTPATITSIAATTANGSYTTGASIAITVTFNKAVNVIGAPQLALNSGGTASYVSGSGSSVLTFVYVVAAGQNSTRLDASSNGALLLNGGTIQDASATAANLLLPTPGAAGSLGANTAIVIDTTAPTVVSYSVQWGAQTYNLAGSLRNRLPWQITGIQVVFSKPIAIADTATLSGISAGGMTGLGTNTLSWSFSPLTLGTFSTVLAGTGANALKDAAGNALAGGSGFSQTLKILCGDFNDDGVVNAQDLALVNAARNQPYNIFADLNGDGVVDINDYELLRLHLGSSLP